MATTYIKTTYALVYYLQTSLIVNILKTLNFKYLDSLTRGTDRERQICKRWLVQKSRTSNNMNPALHTILFYNTGLTAIIYRSKLNYLKIKTKIMWRVSVMVCGLHPYMHCFSSVVSDVVAGLNSIIKFIIS